MMRARSVAATVGLAAVIAVATGAAGPPADFSFDRFLGTYEDLDIEAMPMQSGPLDLRLSSPSNTVTLEAGGLRMTPAEDGLHKVTIEATFFGEGELVTEVKLGTLPARFEDRVRFPRQERVLAAWLTVEAVEDGYRVVVEEVPESVTIRLESGLAARLVGFCRSASLFFAGDAACGNLETMLSNPRLPLPKPGSEYLVSYTQLTDQERERLDVYLAGAEMLAGSGR